MTKKKHKLLNTQHNVLLLHWVISGESRVKFNWLTSQQAHQRLIDGKYSTMIKKFSERDGVSDNVDGDGHSTKKKINEFLY